jgi:mRNA interferase RelE/StbE
MRQLERLDHTTRARIFTFLRDRVAGVDNPLPLAKSLKGSRLRGLVRFRIGDYRVVAQIAHGSRSILVLAVDHRSVIYR